jgi:hypothetical protein
MLNKWRAKQTHVTGIRIGNGRQKTANIGQRAAEENKRDRESLIILASLMQLDYKKYTRQGHCLVGSRDSALDVIVSRSSKMQGKLARQSTLALCI